MTKRGFSFWNDLNLCDAWYGHLLLLPIGLCISPLLGGFMLYKTYMRRAILNNPALSEQPTNKVITKKKQFSFWEDLKLCDTWHGHILLIGFAYHACIPLCAYMLYKVFKYHIDRS